MARIALEIPKAFGKTLLAEHIQEFVIQACAQAWEEGFYAAGDGEFQPEPGENPYKEQ